MEAGPNYGSAIAGRIEKNTSADTIALIVVPDKPNIGRRIFMS